jgi:hypothetical protein
MNSKERITVLLACNANGTDKFPLLLIGKNESPHCFKNVRKLPTKYAANRMAWVTQATFTDYLRALDAKMSSQNRKILLFTNQCAAHPKDTSYVENLKFVLFPQTAPAFSNHMTGNNQVTQTLLLQATCMNNYFYD